jgi:hypothetical protein
MIRFTIRDVIWLTIIVALAVCWRLESARLNAELLADSRQHERLCVFAQSPVQSNMAAGRRIATLQQALKASQTVSPLP